MAVGGKHELFKKMEPMWTKQRDAIEGEDAVKGKGTTYLPKLSGQSEVQVGGVVKDVPLETYAAYKGRAVWLPATARTVEGMSGLIMRKDPDLSWPEAQMPMLEDVGRELESFDELTNVTLGEVIGIGRYGHLVDMPENPFGDEEPFVSQYMGETIVDWDLVEIDGRKKTGMVELVEFIDSEPDKNGKKKKIEQRRRLILGVPMPETDQEQEIVEKEGMESFLLLFGLTMSDFEKGPVYFQELWQEVEGRDQSSTDRFVRISVVVPRLPGGAPWREIPWTFFNPLSTKAKPEKPPLADLTGLNYSHYRNSADLEHGAHFTALPQPWAAGWDFKGNPMYIGSATAWVTKEPNAKAGYLEFTGAGLGFLKELMSDKKKDMAAAGARLLEEPSPASGAEAAETVKMRHSGEHSVLSRISRATSEGLTHTLKFIAMFKAMDPDKVGIRLNLDFGVQTLPPEALKAYMEAVINGHMSWNSLFWLMKKHELIPDNIDEEAEMIRIQAGMTDGPPLGDAKKKEDEDEDEDEEEDE